MSGSGRSLRAEPVVNQAPTGLGHAATVSNAMDLKGDKYSPNLSRWLRKNAKKPYGNPSVYKDLDNGIWIGWIDDDMWFIGSRIWRVFGVGAKAEVGCWTFPISELSIWANFWDQYAEIGRCVVDPEHNRYWIGGETRWHTNGSERSCLWCNNHTQKLVKWDEIVHREKWTDVKAIEARQGADAVNESAVAESDLPEGKS